MKPFLIACLVLLASGLAALLRLDTAGGSEPEIDDDMAVW